MFRSVHNTLDDADLNLFLIDSDMDVAIAIEDADASKEEISELLYSLSEKGNWAIDSILSEIQMIEDYDIRNLFRRFLISKKYNILARYPRGGTKDYAITYADDDCVLVDSPRRPYIVHESEEFIPTSTIVLSPIGEIKVPEGNVYINGNSATVHGFIATWNGLQGLYTHRGDMFLPCIFENVTNTSYERYHYVRYKGIYYMLSPIQVDQDDDFYSKLIIYFYGKKAYELSLIYPSPSFLIETKQYKVDEDAFMVLAKKNEEELCGILDKHFHRLG